MSGRRLRRAELEGYAARGAEAALAGVALRALIDLYLSACWRLWRELPTVDDGIAERRSGRPGWRCCAPPTTAWRRSPRGSSRRATTWPGARSRPAGRSSTRCWPAVPRRSAVLVRAADLGLDLAARTPCSSRPDGEVATAAAAALPGRLERALQGRHGDAGVLLAVKDGALVCIVAAPDRAGCRVVSRPP